MFERFSEPARKLMTRSEGLAREMGSGVVGEEHFLLLLLEDEGMASATPSLQLPVLHGLAAELRGRQPLAVEGQKSLRFTPQAKRCLQAALAESLARHDNYIGFRHLMLGVLQAAGEDPVNVVAQMLDRTGVDPVAEKRVVSDNLDEGDRRSASERERREAELDVERRDPARCLFCAIVDRREPASRVFEDDQVIAFLDVQPINSGHVLVVPRRHLPYLEDVGEDLGAHMFTVGQRIAAALRRSELRCAGVGLQLADGAAAGQEISTAICTSIPGTSTTATA